MTLRFDQRVAVVTGSARGLGYHHALLLAARGAKVVVNDIDGPSGPPAQLVVDEIVRQGGSAVASTHPIGTPADAEAVVADALEAYGRIDILVNNAGITRDRAFQNMSDDEVNAVIDVHLRGALYLTRSAWPHMREAEYGRIVFTTSAAGIFGNFGQANYSAAKAGIIGLSHTLAIEGERRNIRSNTIAPIARTQMTEGVLGKFIESVADPAQVSPLVAWLAHEACPTSGAVYSVGGGRVSRVITATTDGYVKRDAPLTPEDVEDAWEKINDTSALSFPATIADDFRALRDALRH